MLKNTGSLPRVECPELVEGLYWVYIVECSNRTLYVGQTGNIANRIKCHEDGAGARHTRLLAPFTLTYFEGPMDFEAAGKRERQLKKWSRAKKIALILGDLEKLKELSRSKD